MLNPVIARDHKPTKAELDRERQLLEEVTVTRTVSERAGGVLSHTSHRKAVTAMQNQGVVVIRGLYNKEEVINSIQ